MQATKTSSSTVTSTPDDQQDVEMRLGI